MRLTAAAKLLLIALALLLGFGSAIQMERAIRRCPALGHCLRQPDRGTRRLLQEAGRRPDKWTGRRAVRRQVGAMGRASTAGQAVMMPVSSPRVLRIRC